ncbi:MAG: phosphatase PAP2 family protein [Sandaracinaceae bacterium]|nr:phosphatase PAP2 family protein [Sandaracinaceae bacterium]
MLSFVLVMIPCRTRADEGEPAPPARAGRAGRVEATGRTPPPTSQPPRAPMRDLGVADAAFSGVLSASILSASIVPLPIQRSASWQGGILFDDATRGGLQLGSPSARQLAATLSDGLVLGLTAVPVLLDAAIMAWLVRGDPELMGRMILIDLQAHLRAGAHHHLQVRGRPRAPHGARVPRGRAAAARRSTCDSRPDPEIAPESFFSGHTSLAFTSAALICLHHTELGLFGPEGDAATCATGLALASTVGILRILADRHYATDVILGAGVGILSGWLVPWLLHYDVADAAGLEGTSATLAPMIDGQNIGVQLFGAF